jgi:hypothetical protein
MIDSGTLLDERIDHRLDGGDHERFAHYANKNEIMKAHVEGTPIVALCGKMWVPSRDPKKFPVCPDCKRIYDDLPEGPTA